MQVVISLPLWIKFTMGQFSYRSFFCANSELPILATLLNDGYILAIQQIITRGAFAIHFLICSYLLNCLRTLAPWS